MVHPDPSSLNVHASAIDPTVVLIHPPAVSKRYMKTKFMPYGMAVICAYLKGCGVPVLQYDFLMEYLFHSPDDIDFHSRDRSFSEEDFFAALRGNCRHAGLNRFVEKYASRITADAGIYAFSIVAYHQFWASLLIARELRMRNPLCVVVFGGPFITIKPYETFVGYGIADYWVKGSGEIPLMQLHRLHQGSSEVARDNIPGLIFRDGEDLIRVPRSHLSAEEELPPDFAGLALEQYRYDHPLTGEETLFLPYRISKGCTSRCSFCTGRLVDRYDGKSVDKVVTEVQALARTYGATTFQFADASINSHPKRLSEICDRFIATFPELRWYAYARVKGFDASLLRKVHEAGCFSLFWGVESAYQPTVRLLGKRFEVEKMYELMDQSISVGIKNYVHLMYNTPHETEEDVKAFIALVRRYIDSELVVFLPQRFLLEPHSLMHEHPERYGLIDLETVGSSIFERDQFIYGEEPDGDHPEVQKRNERHRHMLAECLDLIHFTNMMHPAMNRSMRWLMPRFLVYTGRYAERSRVAATVHTRLLERIAKGSRNIREQL